jgi:hypothetical protein
VYGDARVYGNAWVYGNAQVSGDAQVYGNAWDHSPLYIQSARYSMNVVAKGVIRIGCQIKTVQEWQKDGMKCAKEHGVTGEALAEIKMLFKTTLAWMKAHKCLKPNQNTER